MQVEQNDSKNWQLSWSVVAGTYVFCVFVLMLAINWTSIRNDFTVTGQVLGSAFGTASITFIGAMLLVWCVSSILERPTSQIAVAILSCCLLIGLLAFARHPQPDVSDADAVAAELDAHAQRWYAQYPALDIEASYANQAAIQRVIDRRNALHAQGMPLTDALDQAVKEIGPSTLQ